MIKKIIILFVMTLMIVSGFSSAIGFNHSPKSRIERENTPPDRPERPYGPEEGKINTEYEWCSRTIDPDGDQLYYWFDWGDYSNSGWIGPYESGEVACVNHTYREINVYPIHVKAKDVSYGAESEWSSQLVVNMLTDKAVNKPFLNFVQSNFESFPNLFPLLQRLLGL